MREEEAHKERLQQTAAAELGDDAFAGGCKLDALYIGLGEHMGPISLLFKTIAGISSLAMRVLLKLCGGTGGTYLLRKRSVILDQVTNGVAVRMAVLYLLNGGGERDDG